MAVGSSSGPPPAIAAGSVPAGAASHAQPLGEVVVEHVPDRLAQLPRTIILTGMITAQEEGGAVLLKTQVGELTIRSPIALPTDKILAIQIPPGAPPVRATISIMSVGPASLVEAPPTTQVASPPILQAPLSAQSAQNASGGPTLAVPTAQAALSSAALSARPITPFSSAALSAQMALLPLLEGSVVEAQVHALPVPGVMSSLPLLTAGSDSANSGGAPGWPLLAALMKGQAKPEGTASASPSLIDLLAGKTTPAASVKPASTMSLQGASLPESISTFSGMPPTSAPANPATSTSPTAAPLVAASSALASFGAKALQTLTPSTLGPMLSGLSDQRALQTLSPSALTQTTSALSSTEASPSPSSPTIQAPSFARAFLSAHAIAEPAFQSFPSLLALPPGSVATFQVETIELPAAATLPPVQTEGSAAVDPTKTTSVTEKSIPAVKSSQPAIQPSGAMSPQALPTAEPVAEESFSAIVVGRAPQGQALATSPLGLLVLETKADLPVGTRVGLSVLHVDEPPEQQEAAPATPATPKDWPALQTLVSILPPESRGGVHMARPQTFGASVLFMLTALRFGDIRPLVKDDILKAARESGADELISRVMGELSQTAQNWQRPEAQNDSAAWRSLALPLWSDGSASRLALHVRREPDPESAEGEGRAWGQRLVVEVNLSRLGPLLLDGFILSKRFSLTLRSQRKLNPALQRDLQQAFDASLGNVGWGGHLLFETAAEVWLNKKKP